jgi:hypothetical protein
VAILTNAVQQKRKTPSTYRVARRKITAVIRINIPAELYNQKTMAEINAMKSVVDKELRSTTFSNALVRTVEERLKSSVYLIDVSVSEGRY